MSRLFAKSFAKCATALLFITTSALKAQEPTSWFVGFGGGYGLTKIDTTYSASASGLGGLGWVAGTWSDLYTLHTKSWGFALEALVGYKHFLNDYIGFRYYANVGAQFYKDATFSSNKTKIGVIDYKLNADLLVNFYNSPAYSIGLFGGFGVGGAYFDSPEIDRYNTYWGGATDSTQYTEAIFDGIGDVYRNHFSASLSAGLRINFLQHIRGAGQVVCSAGGDGRRTCKKPSSLLEHSLEAGAHFFMLSYEPTTPPEVVGRICEHLPGDTLGGKYHCARQRYGYEIKTPYRFTLRYIIAF